jgi:hypothetical protein
MAKTKAKTKGKRKPVKKTKKKLAAPKKRVALKRAQESRLKKLPKKVVAKSAAPAKPAKLHKLSKKENDFARKADMIITKGRERGFITYDEILKEFPNIEEDVMFLDQLYERLNAASIDVLEGGVVYKFFQRRRKPISFCKITLLSTLWTLTNL